MIVAVIFQHEMPAMSDTKGRFRKH